MWGREFSSWHSPHPNRPKLNLQILELVWWTLQDIVINMDLHEHQQKYTCLELWQSLKQLVTEVFCNVGSSGKSATWGKRFWPLYRYIMAFSFQRFSQLSHCIWPLFAKWKQVLWLLPETEEDWHSKDDDLLEVVKLDEALAAKPESAFQLLSKSVLSLFFCFIQYHFEFSLTLQTLKP